MCELRGRWSQGAALSRSEIKVYETKELPVPDPRLVSDDEREKIVTAFYELIERENEIDEDERNVQNTMEQRDKLDKKVLEAFGLDDRLDELKEAINQMIAMREKEAGEKTQVLVSRHDEREVIELEGVESARESTTLGDFE